MKVFAPGKLILSGEHAVVYGQPALAMAINRYATATVTREILPQILFDLADLAHQKPLSFEALRYLKDRVKNKYQRFIQGDFSIREVLQKPCELAQFALGVFTEAFNLSMPHGVKIRVQSDIPMGCGMGSSAATILSVMYAVSHYLQISLPPLTLFELALEAENMQHGRSSGLDLQVSMQGGCLYMDGVHFQKRPLPSWPLYLVNTGIPRTTTGQSVEKVAPFFKQTDLGDEFGMITQAMDVSLQAQQSADFYRAIKANHQLLIKIGVVPSKVQTFIAHVEKLNGAAKICGAGAVAGERAGAVLVVVEEEECLAKLCKQFGYVFTAVTGDLRGIHVAI